MATLGTVFGVTALAMSGKKPQQTTPPIQAGSSDEENFIKYSPFLYALGFAEDRADVFYLQQGLHRKGRGRTCEGEALDTQKGDVGISNRYKRILLRLV